MSTVVRKLRINKRLALSACSWCGDELKLGEDGAVCEACESVHHARCWHTENGCGQTDCINAPLLQSQTLFILDERLSPGELDCPHCGRVIPSGADCAICQQPPRHDTQGGERDLSDEAFQAFLLGLISVFGAPILVVAFYDNYRIAIWLPLIVGVQCGRKAFRKARVAKSQIVNDGTLRGNGLATSAQILGVLGVTLAAGQAVLMIGGLFRA